MQVDWLAVIRLAMVVVIAVAAYQVGKHRGRNQGFLIGLFGVSAGKIEVEQFKPSEVTDPDDVVLLEEMLRMFDEEKDDLM